MSYIQFYYHSVNVAVQSQDSLSYIQSDQPAGILIDMWKLIMLVLNSQDTLFIDSNFTYSDVIDRNVEHEIILNFYETYDYQVSQSYVQQAQYNRTLYQMSEVIISENYLFVFWDNFWPVTLKTILQIFVYIGFLIIPWIILNLNFISFFLLDVVGKPYYYQMRAALEEFVGNNKKEKNNLCKSIYKLFFIITTVLIMIILFTDFIYLLINILAKSNFNTIQDLKDYNAKACYYNKDVFLQNMFERDRELLYMVGQTQLDCLLLLQEQDVDVVIMNEFYLLKLLEQNTYYLNKLRYQVNLNTNIAHHILINNNQPEWFQNHLSMAIDFIQRQKLDLLVKEKYLPTQLQNSKYNSLMPNQPTFQLICAISSLVFIIILQITLVHRQYLKYKNRNVWKGEKII